MSPPSGKCRIKTVLIREVRKMVDDAKLHQFMGQMLSDLGGAASVALVRIGDALGLYTLTASTFGTATIIAWKF